MALIIRDGGRQIYAKVSGFKATLWPDGRCTADIRVQYFVSRKQRLAGPGFGQFSDDVGPRPEVFSSVTVGNSEPALDDIYTALRTLDRFSDAKDA